MSELSYSPDEMRRLRAHLEKISHEITTMSDELPNAWAFSLALYDWGSRHMANGYAHFRSQLDERETAHKTWLNETSEALETFSLSALITDDMIDDILRDLAITIERKGY